MKSGKSKQKGNAFENKVSKQLSMWMFGSPIVLQRHLTSGAQKGTYIGDIVPAKMEMFTWKKWPILVECKHGYENQISDFSNQKLIREWIEKAIIERGDQELIIYLIVKFHRRKTLLITDLPFHNKTAPLILNHQKNGDVYPFHIYDYDDILKLNFYELYNNNSKLKEEVFNKL